jgi:hypothetical protein
MARRRSGGDAGEHSWRTSVKNKSPKLMGICAELEYWEWWKSKRACRRWCRGRSFVEEGVFVWDVAEDDEVIDVLGWVPERYWCESRVGIKTRNHAYRFRWRTDWTWNRPVRNHRTCHSSSFSYLAHSIHQLDSRFPQPPKAIIPGKLRKHVFGNSAGTEDKERKLKRSGVPKISGC